MSDETPYDWQEIDQAIQIAYPAAWGRCTVSVPIGPDRQPAGDPVVTFWPDDVEPFDLAKIKEIAARRRAGWRLPIELTVPAAEQFLKVREGGFTYAGHAYATTGVAARRIFGFAQMFELDASLTSMQWTDTAGTVTLTRDEGVNLAAAVDAFLKATDQAFLRLQGLIDAATISSLQELEAWDGWPEAKGR